MKLGGRMTGGKELSTRIVVIKGASDPAVLLPAMLAGGEPIAEGARQRVRSRTGRLHDSIGVGTELSPHQAAIHRPEGRVEVFVGPGALPEAITEEFGTAHEAAHPYMRPAWDGEQQAAIDKVADAMSAEIDKRAKG